ncbi:MAG: LacI family DNA-binding transcriptional regulator [Janthinobacterium lividum]
MAKIRPTITDVAQDSGVSIATVSYVINNGPRNVDVDTRARVEASMERLKYYPNSIARALTNKRLNAIGVVFPHPYPSVFTDPYFISIMDGIVQEAAKRHQNVLLYTGLEWNGTDSLPAFRDRRVDGLLLIAMLTDSTIVPALVEAEMEFVQINGKVTELAVSNVDIDNSLAVREVISHLAALGHRRIALLGGQLNSPSTQPRRDGYFLGMQEHGLPVDLSIVLEGTYSREWGREGMARLLASDNPPTAVFAGGDGIAEGIYDICARAGVRIPHDLSVIGFDDTPAAPHLDPPLTSVRQPLVQMGSTAAAMLLDQLDAKAPEGSTTTRQIVLPAKLIVRESTAASMSFRRGERIPMTSKSVLV